MPTAYLGTSAFAASVLRRLAASPHRPAVVVTRPDAPKGRGRRLAPPPVAGAACELGIDVLQPEDVNDEATVERIASFGVDTVLLCAFGALIKEPLLSRFGAILNVHPSLLPRWRGAAPIERAIMAGDDETGVTIMALTEGLDDGPVCASGRERIRPDDTYGTLSERLEELGASLLVHVLDEQPEFEPQPDEGITYAEKIGAEDRTLDPSRPASELERVVRALTPHVGARIALPDGSFLGVRAAGVRMDGPEPGTFASADGRLVVGTPDGALELREVQPAGGKPMAAEDYLRGRPL